MSLDDHTPTEYFGPGVRRVGLPGGGYLQIPAEHFEKMVASGTVIALSPEEELADILELANTNTRDTDTGHRQGCAFGRTARCTCTYITQWDRTPDYTTPTFSPAFAARDIEGNPLAVTVTTTLDYEQGFHNEQIRAKYWYDEYRAGRRSFHTMTALAITGWALSLARGIWGF